MTVPPGDRRLSMHSEWSYIHTRIHKLAPYHLVHLHPNLNISAINMFLEPPVRRDHRMITPSRAFSQHFLKVLSVLPARMSMYIL